MKNPSFIILFLIFSYSCTEKEEPLFTQLPSGLTNVDFVNLLTEDETLNMIEYLYFNNGGGVAAGDINNDGLVDLYFTSNQQSNRLYLNKGNLQFEDITEEAGVAGSGDWTSGVTMADVNGDDYLDIYVCQVGDYKGLEGSNQLFINQGNGTFQENAGSYGLDFQGFSTQAAFFDYDLDGDLDLYLLNHSVHTSRSYGSKDLRFEHDVRAGDRLYRNDISDSGYRFKNVSREAGIYSSHIGYGLGVNIADINNDGAPDIYVSNDFHEDDYLYINNGNGTFTERLREMIAHTSRSSMGNDVADINNDGLLDIVVLDMLPDDQKIRKKSGGEDDYELFRIKRRFGYYHQFVRNTLQLNLGGGKFSEIGAFAGIHTTDWSWSPLICDLDNDGLKDLVITNGIYRRANDLDYVQFLTRLNRAPSNAQDSTTPDRELYERMPLHPNTNYLFRNNGDLTFTNMAFSWGFEIPTFSNGATYADLDNDGDLDLVVNNINSPAMVYRNNTESKDDVHFLSVELRGEGMNTRAIGTRLTLFSGGEVLMAEQYPTRGFLSAVPQKIHFGTGGNTRIDSLVVRWPGQAEEVIYNVDADQRITLEMEKADRSRAGFPSGKVEQKQFTRDIITGLDFVHRENVYVDMNRERLIPHNLSAEGPAIAAADVNGDGLEDLFLGGAKGQPSTIYIQENNGNFIPAYISVLLKDRYAEDVDAAFFDADGDSDPDLYIVRGGNEVAAGEGELRDRMLINDGKGNFKPCEKGALPHIASNGSCVQPADFDGDGDMDLFVGSRSVPGAYGLSPRQFLLENDGEGKFTDVTDKILGWQNEPGMVTDVCWTDYDLDGDPDLVVVGEWMKVTILSNQEGYFSEMTGYAGMEETAGWWYSVKAGDIDLDGDMDLVAGNLGLNSLMKASHAEPVEMYVNDFDNNGTFDQLICAYDQGKSFPVASLDQLASQVTGIRKMFPNYADYGGKTAWEIFGRENLDQAFYRRAELFASCLFRNNGKGVFDIEMLPAEAQFSPVRDLVIHDMNRDGQPDLVLVGNNYSVRPSYGRYDASFGWYLPGDPELGFSVQKPVESGLKIEGDARRIIHLEIDGAPHLVVGINDDSLRIFRF